MQLRSPTPGAYTPRCSTKLISGGRSSDEYHPGTPVLPWCSGDEIRAHALHGTFSTRSPASSMTFTRRAGRTRASRLRGDRERPRRLAAGRATRQASSRRRVDIGTAPMTSPVDFVLTACWVRRGRSTDSEVSILPSRVSPAAVEADQRGRSVPVLVQTIGNPAQGTRSSAAWRTRPPCPG